MMGEAQPMDATLYPASETRQHVCMPRWPRSTSSGIQC